MKVMSKMFGDDTGATTGGFSFYGNICNGGGPSTANYSNNVTIVEGKLLSFRG